MQTVVGYKWNQNNTSLELSLRRTERPGYLATFRIASVTTARQRHARGFSAARPEKLAALFLWS
jgi:hypothetical protein